MQFKKHFVYLLLIAVFILGACAPNASDSTAMDKPTEAMMEKTAEPMADKPTDAMMDKPTEAMMEKTAEPMADKPTDAMMDKPTEPMMEKTADPMMEKPTEAMMDETAEPMMAGTVTPDAMTHATPAGTGMKDQPTDGAMMEAPGWFSASLTDVASGKMFTIDDYKGKVVLVELMAQWCPTCLRQQKQVVDLHKQLGMDTDLVTIALDIDPNEDAETLKAYAASNGFDWIYAVAPPEVAREIGNLYGSQYLNPPSAPMLLINRKGEVMPLPFGVKSADELNALIQPLLNEGM